MKHTRDIDLLLASAPNAIDSSTPAPLADGFLVGVQPSMLSGTAPPPGRYYVRVFLASTPVGGTFALSDTIAVLWEGYLSGGAGPVSRPNFPIDTRDTVVVQVTEGTNGVATDVVRVRLTWTDAAKEAVGGAWIYSVTAGSGPGEIIAINPGQPGAGVDWTYTMPANVRRRFKAYAGLLTTSAQAATRTVHIQGTDGGAGHLILDETSPSTQAASLAYEYSAGSVYQRVAVNDTTVTLNLPDLVLIPGWKLFAATTNIQTGDQWSSLHLTYEEWACPAP